MWELPVSVVPRSRDTSVTPSLCLLETAPGSHRPATERVGKLRKDEGRAGISRWGCVSLVPCQVHHQ